MAYARTSEDIQELTAIRNVARTVASVIDGRTVDGHRARLIDKHLTRLLEDLAAEN